ncbi:hypothetical protein V494_00102 [Pseudogymnoascus sp. VKM F-4513 (FW-928)]|nr:hypothetical protein V494_00102 [Pseudogymnoascus sp. VKM F-4513 (FW-928)]
MVYDAALDAAFRGSCFVPFLQEELYANITEGYIPGRICTELAPNITCCLPCPSTDWLYPDSFATVTNASSWLNVVGLVCTVFLLLSFAILPVEKTHRHYLSICLVIAIVIMQLGFVIPLGAKPEQCANAITPHGMESSTTCALSGAFLLAGGWCGIMWVFMRALALHLQICWQVVIGKAFMWGALIGGWGVPAVALAIAMVFSGVSFRFGETCHINHTNSLADFWIPLLIFGGLTVIIQFTTFGYCIKVYLASLSDSSSTTNSSALPSYSGSVVTLTPRQAYRRIQRVVELQWRGIAIVIIIIIDVIFFAVVFVVMDNNQIKAANVSAETIGNTKPGEENPSVEWLACLVGAQGDKGPCLEKSANLIMNQATITAVLVLLSCNGIWLLLLMSRLSMYTGWYDLVTSRTKPNGEFISADAARAYSKDPSTYEMLASNGRDVDYPSKPDLPLTQLSPAVTSPTGRSGRQTPDYFGREAKYQNPTHSFSSPRPPPGGRDWNSASTHAPSAHKPHIDPLSMNKF